MVGVLAAVFTAGPEGVLADGEAFCRVFGWLATAGLAGDGTLAGCSAPAVLAGAASGVLTGAGGLAADLVLTGAGGLAANLGLAANPGRVKSSTIFGPKRAPRTDTSRGRS
ncbi:MAG: hypothetical protein VYA68_05705, partial [Pseudomonadota bacterium]|nr:hypothetical protein [Pseudomonadota bacterium]